MGDLFPGFASHRLAISSGEIYARVGGAGPPLLCLHGFPESHAMWHRVAAPLAERFTVVAADLPGYGGSDFPPREGGVAGYSKSAMAAAMVEAMATLGFDRFDLLAHDRGARVAYRMMLERPRQVGRGVLLDIIPTIDVWRSFADRREALNMAHWPFLAQPSPLPERLIAGAPDAWLESRFVRGGATLPSWLDPEVYAAYRALHADPARRAAHCDDYRAGATVDVEDDLASLGRGETIAAPLMVLWGGKGNLATLADPLAIWRRWCPGVVGGPVASGHYIPEEAPGPLLDVVLPFLAAA